MWRWGRGDLVDSLAEPGVRRSALFIMWRGLLLLPLAYSFTVLLHGSDIAGRASRVHLAATPGAAILVGAVCAWCMRRRPGRIAPPALAVSLSLLIGF